MRSLANKLVLASHGASIESIGSTGVKAGDIAIKGTGSAMRTGYDDTQPNWVQISKQLGGQWNGPTTPQYHHWAGLYYRILQTDGENIDITHDRSPASTQIVYRMNKPIASVSATEVAGNNYIQTRTFNDPNDSSDAYIAVDFVNFWNPPLEGNFRSTNVQPDHLGYAGNYTGRGVYAKGYLTGAGVSITNSGGHNEYNGSLHPSIKTILKLYT